MEYRIKSIIFIGCMLVVTIYLLITAREDARSCQVTRIKHLAGLVPAVCMLFMNVRARSLSDIGAVLLFMLIFLVCGLKKIYGMADGFVFMNLTLLFGGAYGVAGIGVVILIMVLACVSGMAEILMRKMITIENFRQKAHIAFVPHILIGYIAVMSALLIWLQ